MRIPDSVKVGPLIYRVERPGVIVDDGTELWGQAQHKELVIRVVSGVNEQRAFVTFLHECLHAIEQVWGIDLTDTQVKQLAFGLAAVLIDNDLVK